MTADARVVELLAAAGETLSVANDRLQEIGSREKYVVRSSVVWGAVYADWDGDPSEPPSSSVLLFPDLQSAREYIRGLKKIQPVDYDPSEFADELAERGITMRELALERPEDFAWSDGSLMTEMGEDDDPIWVRASGEGMRCELFSQEV